MCAAKSPTLTTSAEVRDQIIDALRLDLIGPRPGEAAHAEFAKERLPVAPSIYYLTGFLVPSEAPAEARSDFDGDELLDSAPRQPIGDDTPPPEASASKKSYFPSSFGLSVLVDGETDSLTARLSWADYRRLEKTEDLPGGPVQPEQRAGRGSWLRQPRQAELELDLKAGTVSLPGHEDLKLVLSLRALPPQLGLPEGSRAVSVFFVNQRPEAPDDHRDSAYVFQPELSLSCAAGFVPRPALRGEQDELTGTQAHPYPDWDEQVAALQYADALEFSVGHNVSALAEVEGGVCRRVHTAWMPAADVEKVVPRSLPEAELGMEALAKQKDAAGMKAALQPMIDAYGDWISAQAELTSRLKAQHEGTAKDLIARAEHAKERLQRGLDALGDKLLLLAFRFTNIAMAKAYRQRRSHDRETRPEDIEAPRWRPFQLAFLLMNLQGSADPNHADREIVDLLFFPTGGGKTEAYLGLAAFSMFLRRLRDPSIGSAGVTVLMRYTLRLLTLDQLERAATLVCAMELLRQKNEAMLGPWPFEIGLWVGQAATPNRMGKSGDQKKETARARTLDYRRDSKHKPPPLPLQRCPWCGWSLGPESYQLLPNSEAPHSLQISCRHKKCEFSIEHRSSGLPILAVDEMIYRRLPAFVIATVDKFANLPWVGDSGALFGRVDRHNKFGFYGPTEENRGARLPAGRLPPPALIIQDELHLISGPLGTMVGLYETAVDALARPQLGAAGPGPKIVASTATVRRAERQIRGLFSREAVEVFPPPGLSRRDSFFAQTTPPSEKNPRRYLGVAAPGRNLKVIFLRVTLSLMAAAQRAYKAAGGDKISPNPADPYMSLLSYFNSLRELGGSRRIVEDEVESRLHDYAARRARAGVARQLFANRKLKEPTELTSRVSTAEVAETKRRLALPSSDKARIDLALATNMISVGLDIDRLGLMLVLGQPKTAAEYIQATSRVGRDDKRPGLVVTLLNTARPRDRSHWERFSAWHESFYRAVEATSVTPFSPRAIDRGLAGITVALARLGWPALTPAKHVGRLEMLRDRVDEVADIIADRAAAHDAELNQEAQEALRSRVKARVLHLLDSWQAVSKDKKHRVQYGTEEDWAPLLYTPLDPELKKQSARAREFKAGRSLRDVEPVVRLWLHNPEGDLIPDSEES